MDIFLVEIPESDGHEQAGYRPALLLAEPINEIGIIIPLTSNVLAKKFPYTIKIEPDLENGLTSVSIIMIFQIRAIDKRRLKKKIGRLDIKTVNEIKNLLNDMLNLKN